MPSDAPKKRLTDIRLLSPEEQKRRDMMLQSAALERALTEKRHAERYNRLSWARNKDKK